MDSTAADLPAATNQTPTEVLVGKRLRGLRIRRGFSLRSLADRSGLNINTLSLIENGKSSPSVSTLQQLALALEVSITAFFESQTIEKNIVFTPVGQRPQTTFGATQMQTLGKDLSGNAVQPFVVTLKPGMGSGELVIVHTGYEFVYCLSGSIHYQVDQHLFELQSGDSLVFEARLPHCWENKTEDNAQILLILYPSDKRDTPGGRHFSLETMKKEIKMKIAVITDDGNTISQHFGRAPFFLVLTIEEGKIINREMRDKMGHSQLNDQPHGGESNAMGHGMDSASHNKHVSIAETISDCKALICGGMGMGAYESMRKLNIQPVVTELRDIEAAVQAYIDGKLVDRTELLH